MPLTQHIATISLTRDVSTSSLLQATADYSITVANAGSSTATGLNVRLTIPAGLVVMTLESLAEYDAARATLTWQLPRLAPGDVQEFRFKARTTEPGKHLQQVDVMAGHEVLARQTRYLEVFSQSARGPQDKAPVAVAVSDQDPVE